MEHSQYFALLADFEANRNFTETFSDSSSMVSLSSSFSTILPDEIDEIDENYLPVEELLEFDVHWVLEFANRTRLHFPYYTCETLNMSFQNMIARPEFDGFTMNDLKFYLRGHQLEERDMRKPFRDLFGNGTRSAKSVWTLRDSHWS